jgi:hypothetical protein
MQRPTVHSHANDNPYRRSNDRNKEMDWESERQRLIHDRTMATLAQANANARQQASGGNTPPSTAGCFPAGTRVLIDGGVQAIETIVPGQFVLAPAAGSRTLRPCQVLRIKRVASSTLWSVSIAGRDTAISTTANHFFRTGRGWVRTRSLRRHDEIVGAHGGTLVVASVTNTGSAAPVYNLIVDRACTYVADGCVVHSFGLLPTVRTVWHRYVRRFRRHVGAVPAAEVGAASA